MTNSVDDALFYKAVYKLDELENMEGAYDDLVAKLTSLYGTPQDKSYFNTMSDAFSPKGAVWYAKDGSLVLITMYFNSYSGKYDELWITYAAPDTDELLINLENQIQQEAVEAEEAERIKNSTNTDGL